jgi:hypothetical protein
VYGKILAAVVSGWMEVIGGVAEGVENNSVGAGVAVTENSGVVTFASVGITANVGVAEEVDCPLWPEQLMRIPSKATSENARNTGEMNMIRNLADSSVL